MTLLSVLLFLGFPAVIAGSIVFTLKYHYEIITFLGKLAGLFYSVNSWFRRKHIGNTFTGKVNAFSNSKIGRLLGLNEHRLRINWVRVEEASSVLADGGVIVNLGATNRKKLDYCNACYLFVNAAILPNARHILDEDVEKAIVLTVTRDIISREKDPEYMSLFSQEIVKPLLQQDERLVYSLQSARNIDDAGLLSRILVPGIKYVGEQADIDLEYDVTKVNVTGLFDKLNEITRRKKGEDIQLTYQGRYLSYAFILVAKPEKVKERNIYPYIEAIEYYKKRSYRNIILLARGKNIWYLERLSGIVKNMKDIEIRDHVVFIEKLPDGEEMRAGLLRLETR